MEYLLGGCSGTLAVSPPMQKKTAEAICTAAEER